MKNKLLIIGLSGTLLAGSVLDFGSRREVVPEAMRIYSEFEAGRNTVTNTISYSTVVSDYTGETISKSVEYLPGRILGGLMTWGAVLGLTLLLGKRKENSVEDIV